MRRYDIHGVCRRLHAGAERYSASPRIHLFGFVMRELIEFGRTSTSSVESREYALSRRVGRDTRSNQMYGDCPFFAADMPTITSATAEVTASKNNLPFSA